MNTNNIYLRFHETYDGQPVNEVYESIVNVIHGGVPIVTEGEHEGKDMESDGLLYRHIGGNHYLEVE